MHRRCLIPVALLLSLPAAAPAGVPEYFPLQISNEWSYATPSGETEVRTVSGTTSIWGHEVFVIQYDSVTNAGLENYWSLGTDGDVFLHGAYRSVENFGLLFDPPIRFLDAPLSLGRNWSQEVRVFFLPDTTGGDTTTFHFTVYEAGPQNVPAGTFDSFGLGQGPFEPALSSLGPYTLTGELRESPAGSNATDWFSDGIGVVRYRSSGDFRLTSYSLPTLARSRTWGAIKATYR
jgi:hypothetical protein